MKKEIEITNIQKLIVQNSVLTNTKLSTIYKYIFPDASQYEITKFSQLLAVRHLIQDTNEKHEKDINRRIKAEKENAINEYKKKLGDDPFRGTEHIIGTKTPVNFTNRNEFINYLNEQVNTIQDDKTRTDYLKMLSDLLRFKETETGKNNEIMAFYTPLTCYKCPLYVESLDR